jgi:hypothetical protein
MDKQEIINILVTKENYDKVIDICINDNLIIPNKYSPEIYIYHETSHLLNSTYLDDYTEININSISFVVNGETKSGINDFFKNYKDISEIKLSDVTYRVIPHITNGNHYYKSSDSDYTEIGYSCHSLNKPAIEYYDKKIYFINGSEIEYKDWIKLNRSEKLANILYGN